ncbi:hypothetical protein TUM19329_08720 [Legionella antarctica]|uniref:DUF5638 domain-containing protein n=1 Tax=Legionella antarctica TaxID=2708020 RepID=A0A6F8T220_9GAMM|nr:DUF5638 domain-containing protein [Legionella antarctica]BCA94511.1 hypothetical protein TUM19329_08720 [Legionella antarctica]
MPSFENAELLKKKIVDCNRELDSLFTNLNPDIKLKEQASQIKYFYKRAFDKTSNENTALKIVQQYEQFITTASEVQLGQLTAAEANRVIDDVTEDRQFNILKYNIFKVCELIFWTAVAAASYSAGLTLGIPLMFLEPLIGFTITAGTAILFAVSITNASDCFDEFKTFDRVNFENSREKDVISFFSRQPSPKLNETDAEENVDSYNSTIYT